MWLALTISLIYLVYGVQMIRFWAAWKAIDTPPKAKDLPVAVIIPFRNEAKQLRRLVKGLTQQEHANFELIFVNDHSEDDGEEVLLKALKGQSVNFRLLHLEDTEGKKAALALGISAARHPLIVTTDADCYMDRRWLQSMTAAFSIETVQMVAGPVQYIKDSLFARWQAIEFQALIAVGAAGIQRRHPTMANGANFAFKKAAFDEVNGYAHTPNTPSGDDEFLLQKFAEHWPAGVRFNKDQAALVVTKASTTWKEFKEQRIRWASKWKQGRRPHVIRLALLVGSIQLAQLLVYVGFLWTSDYWSWWLGLLLFRLIAEGNLVYRTSKDMGASRPFIVLFVLSFIIYPFYAVYFALLANFGSFNWKGRSYR